MIRGTLADESWSGYHNAHYEADDEGYQNEDDEHLRIDEHRLYPFRADKEDLEALNQLLNFHGRYSDYR